jgi:hypothetical protein
MKAQNYLKIATNVQIIHSYKKLSKSYSYLNALPPKQSLQPR